MLNIDYSDLPEDVVAVLKSDAVQTVLIAAFENANTGEDLALKRNRDEILGEKRELERKLAEIEALGGLQALKNLPELDKKVKIKSEAESTYAEQVKELQRQLTAMKDQAAAEKLNSRLYKEITDADGVPELLESHIKSRVRHEIDPHGALKLTVLDKNGVELFVDGREASVKDLISEFKAHPTLARAFNAPALNGSNTKATNGNGVVNPFSKATLNISEQGRLVKSDRQEAVRLANQAGVKIPGLNA